MWRGTFSFPFYLFLFLCGKQYFSQIHYLSARSVRKEADSGKHPWNVMKSVTPDRFLLPSCFLFKHFLHSDVTLFPMDLTGFEALNFATQ